MAGHVAAHHQREQRQRRRACGHQDRHQPFGGAPLHQRKAEGLILLALQMAEMAEQHDAVACRDTQHGNEPDQCAHREHPASQRRCRDAADQREGQAERDERDNSP